MKWILIISAIFGFSANANNKINFTLEHSPQIIENLLIPVWEEIPYTHTWTNKANSTAEKTLSAHIVNAKINLGKKGSPLVDFSPVGKDLVDLNWKLSKLQIEGVVRVKFQYKKFGLKLSHTEEFNFQGHQINGAKSRVSLIYDQAKLNLNIVSQSGFKFNRVAVSPRNGMGKTLRWIFDNVFNKNEVDRFVTNRANNELQKWVNSKEIINDIETAVNKELDEFQKNQIRLGDLSTNVVVKVDDFSLDETAINVKADVSFDNQDRKIHMCAKDLMQDFARKQKKNLVESANVSVTHPLIEQGLLNFSSYEMFDTNNKLMEPLFCIGYKEFNQRGEPKGEKTDIKIGVRKFNFNYWVKPRTAPHFTYHVDNNEVLVGMKFAINIKSDRIPRARVVGGPLIVGVLVGFSPKHDPAKGLVLEFNGLEITEISGGSLQVKWSLLLPYIKINVAKYEQSLEKMLNDEIENSLENGQLVIVDQLIDATDELSLELRGHELTNDSHNVQFDLVAK